MAGVRTKRWGRIRSGASAFEAMVVLGSMGLRMTQLGRVRSNGDTFGAMGVC
jgi:hypothetical protein